MNRSVHLVAVATFLIVLAVPVVAERDVEADAQFSTVDAHYEDGSSRQMTIAFTSRYPDGCVMASSVKISCPSTGPCIARDLPIPVPSCGMARRRATRR
jgi:hypothetical protein